jgi:hypothetical protein
MRSIYAKAGNKRYKLTVSSQWAIKNDNGCLVSIGLEVGKDLKQTQLDALIRQGKAKEVTEQDFNHSGCQSSCILRGHAKCGW